MSGTKRKEATILRLRGCSYNEIARLLDTPKSTLSGWLKGIVLSNRARKRLEQRQSIGTDVLIRRNKSQTDQALRRAEAIKAAAQNDITPFDSATLRIIGAVLYWAEGYKRLKVINGKERTGHVISFVNSDSEMIRGFLRFSREILGISNDRIKLAMRLYDHIDESAARIHWGKVTGLPSTSFRKTTKMVSIASQRKRPFNRLPFGTLQVEIAQTDKFYRVIGWIEGVKKQLQYGTLGPRLDSSVGRASL